MLIALAGCDRAKTNRAQTQPNKPASFRDTIFASVTPTADGGAYAIGDSGLWYLRGSQAVKVRFSNLPTDKDETFFATLLSAQFVPVGLLSNVAEPSAHNHDSVAGGVPPVEVNPLQAQIADSNSVKRGQTFSSTRSDTLIQTAQ